MSQVYAFSYRGGSSVFHKMPSWIKILFIPLFNVFIFSFDARAALFFVILQFVLFCVLHFSLHEQAADLTPVIVYAVFLYLVDIISLTFFNQVEGVLSYRFISAFKTSILNEKTFSTVIKFFACNQSASLMFKTSTGLELREGIEKIELKIRSVLPVKKTAVFAPVLSMFVIFIPAVFKLWNEIKRAWFARGGKYGVRMFLVLMPVLFYSGLKYAFDSARAVSVRQ